MLQKYRTIHGPENSNDLARLLEGFLFAVGEVCHRLFGPAGEEAVYRAVGEFFLSYLQKKEGLCFDSDDPWLRYCKLIDFFTQKGFYSYVELAQLGPNKYQMLEKDQYASDVWQEQGSWERGSPPCPLWSIVVASLAQAGHAIVLDKVKYRSDLNGFESIFHFEKIDQPQGDIIELTRKRLLPSLIPMCSQCGKIRDSSQNWCELNDYLQTHTAARFSHGLCPECIRKHYPEEAEEILAQLNLPKGHDDDWRANPISKETPPSAFSW